MSLKVDRKNPPTKGDKPMPEPVRPCEPADKPDQTRTTLVSVWIKSSDVIDKCGH